MAKIFNTFRYDSKFNLLKLPSNRSLQLVITDFGSFGRNNLRIVVSRGLIQLLYPFYTTMHYSSGTRPTGIKWNDMNTYEEPLNNAIEVWNKRLLRDHNEVIAHNTRVHYTLSATQRKNIQLLLWLKPVSVEFSFTHRFHSSYSECNLNT